MALVVKKTMEEVQSATASGTHQDSEPIVYINGKLHKLPLGRAEVTLLDYLRGERACSE